MTTVTEEKLPVKTLFADAAVNCFNLQTTDNEEYKGATTGGRVVFSRALNAGTANSHDDHPNRCDGPAACSH